MTVLLPCPDYQSVIDFTSLYTITQVIRGARMAAMEHSTYVVTLPVSDANNPHIINWNQFKHLTADSMVLM